MKPAKIFCDVDVTSGIERCVIEGELDAYSASEFRKVASDLCRAKLVAVDLSRMSFIDSAGLGALVGAIRRIHEADGCIALVAPRANVRRVIETSGIARIVPVLRTTAEVATLVDEHDDDDARQPTPLGAA